MIGDSDPRHRTIVCLDIEGFGDPARTDPDRVEVRKALYRMVGEALAASASVRLEGCHHEDRGDGLFLLVKPEVPKNRLLVRLPRVLAAALARHNGSASPATALRLRVAVHAGEVRFDEYGVTDHNLNLAFRLLDAPDLKAALRDSSGHLALITSPALFEDVVRHDPEGAPDTWRPTTVSVKETRTPAWISRPDAPYPPEPNAPEGFEGVYLRYIKDTLGRLELFGVTRGRASRWHSHADAYVGLAVARADRGSGTTDEEELTGAGQDAFDAFADNRRVVLRAGAGAGKSTLLCWLAAVTAERDLAEASPWRGAVPFFLPLRKLDGAALPTPKELLGTVADVLAEEAPAGWVTGQLRDGNALLLVDGVDEVKVEQRQAVRKWLEDLVAAYPKARYVVTTRPFAVQDDWLSDSGFARYDLLPMSNKGVQDLVERWHRAARAQHTFDAEMQGWLDECERRLADVLAKRPELRRLARTPLLCGLLCALHQDRNMHLPRDRKGLYDAALNLLLVGWDEQRSVRLGEEPSLSEEEQLVLLQRFAYSFVKNQHVLLAREEAVRLITAAMRGLRSHDADPDTVLQRTLERTGLLREPYHGQVQFLHRTFRDYLAAKEIVDSGDLNLLVEHAHQDPWHDVVVMAIAHARPTEREQILKGLLEGNAEAERSPRVRDRLVLVAGACVEQAPVLDSHEVRVRVREAVARLIPPHTDEEADLLAKAGEFVLDLLPGPEDLTDSRAALVVRTAALIGGDQSHDLITRFSTVNNSVVIDELLRAWRQADDPEEYAKTVLSDVDFGERLIDIKSRHRADYLKHLRGLKKVAFTGNLRPLDPIAEIPSLRLLSLSWNELPFDLSPLANCRSLRVLALAQCPFLRDLSPLARTNVAALGLHLMRVDFSTLSGTGIRQLSVSDRELDGGLHPLPSDLPLQELLLDNRAEQRDLRGIERWQGLERVTVNGVPRPEEVRALALLPNLRRLTIRRPSNPTDLARLHPLTSLDVLHLAGVPQNLQDDLLRAAEHAIPNTNIQVSG